jgi:SHAQKYF class myb-like DNA-binding protein
MGFGRWTYAEHKNFIEGIFAFGNKWKEIVKLIKTRNCIQARSHSQKFFFKLFKFADAPDLERYVNLKNLFSFGKEIGNEKLLMVKEFLIQAYDQIENGENVDYVKGHLLVEFLKKLEKSKSKIKENEATANASVLPMEKRRLRMLKKKSEFFQKEKINKDENEEELIFEIKKIEKAEKLKDLKLRKDKVIILSLNGDFVVGNKETDDGKVFIIDKVFAKKAKENNNYKAFSKQANWDFPCYESKSTNTNLQMSEESCLTITANVNKNSKFFESYNCSTIQNLGNYFVCKFFVLVFFLLLQFFFFLIFYSLSLIYINKFFMQGLFLNFGFLLL